MKEKFKKLLLITGNETDLKEVYKKIKRFFRIMRNIWQYRILQLKSSSKKVIE